MVVHPRLVGVLLRGRSSWRSVSETDYFVLQHHPRQLINPFRIITRGFPHYRGNQLLYVLLCYPILSYPILSTTVPFGFCFVCFLANYEPEIAKVSCIVCVRIMNGMCKGVMWRESKDIDIPCGPNEILNAIHPGHQVLFCNTMEHANNNHLGPSFLSLLSYFI